jgi:cytochrome P450
MNATTKNDAGIVPPLFSPEFQRDPYPTYRYCLQGAPLVPLEGRPGVWLVFRYEHCATVIRDARLSSVRPASSLVAVTGDALTEFDDLVRHMQRWLLLRDAPSHSELRRRMNRGFTPAAMQGLRHKVVSIIDSLLDDIEKEDAVDLMKDFAYPLPVRVISELLGVPTELHDRCVVLSNDIAVWFGDVRRSPESARVAQRAIHELEQYFSAIIRERRGTRKDDLLGLLMDAEEGAGGLSEEDLHAQCVMLLFAGHETTRNLIGNGIYTLLKHPDTMTELRNEDSLWPVALEELLRYESPAQAIARTVKSGIEIEGTHLPAGSSIGFMIGAAHRDSRQFPEPDRLDVHRPHLRHLAFGGDAHVCLGITLARLEGQLSLTALTRRFPNLHLLDETPDWGSNFALRGLKTLRVRT